jgi:hypothetical protein
MSKTIILPVSKATVTLKEVKSFKQGDRKKIYEGTDDITNRMVGGWAIIENTLALLIEDWSLELLLPSIKRESLDELEAEDFDTLQEEAQAALGLLWPKLTKTAETDADPKATTADSNG